MANRTSPKQRIVEPARTEADEKNLKNQPVVARNLPASVSGKHIVSNFPLPDSDKSLVQANSQLLNSYQNPNEEHFISFFNNHNRTPEILQQLPKHNLTGDDSIGKNIAKILLSDYEDKKIRVFEILGKYLSAELAEDLLLMLTRRPNNKATVEALLHHCEQVIDIISLRRAALQAAELKDKDLYDLLMGAISLAQQTAKDRN